MDSHGLIPQSNRDRSSLRGLEWDQLGSAMAAGQRHSPPTTGKPATSPNEPQQQRTKSPGPTDLGAIIREEPAASSESTGGFKSLFGRGGKGGRHNKNQSVSNSVASAASSATTAPTLPRSASMTSGTGSDGASSIFFFFRSRRASLRPCRHLL
jgi:hypothetical protein